MYDSVIGETPNVQRRPFDGRIRFSYRDRNQPVVATVVWRPPIA